MERYFGDLQSDLAKVARNRLAQRITGGLSAPGKMPELAWGIPATRCRIGSTLAAVEGAVCASCYAKKGRYRLRHVQQKLERRYEGMQHPLWVPAMVLLIRYHVGRYFRWFDSGDLVSRAHLHAICDIARHTPDILHWLPTQEHDLVREFEGDIPENLVVRLSAHIIDQPPPTAWPLTATVFTKRPSPGSHVCRALEQGNHCGLCRACWDKGVRDVAYPRH